MIRRAFHILLLSLFLFPSAAKADVGVEFGLYGEGFVFRNPYTRVLDVAPVGGVAIYFQAGRRITFNYRYGFTALGDDKFAFRASMSALAAGGMIYHGNSVLFALVGLIPNGIGFYTREDHNGFHIGMDILGSDYYFKERISNQEYWKYAPTLNVRYRFPIKTSGYHVSPYCAFTFGSPVAVSVGVNLSMERIQKKKAEDQGS